MPPKEQDNKDAAVFNSDTNSIIADPTTITSDDVLLAAAEWNGAIVDCNTAMLESMDNCVDCVEGVDLQHDFEQIMDARRKNSAKYHLSPKDAAMIRLQTMENEKQPKQELSLTPSLDLDLLNICGGDEDMTSVPKQAKASSTTAAAPVRSQGGGAVHDASRQVPASVHDTTTTTSEQQNQAPQELSLTPSLDLDLLNICGADDDGVVVPQATGKSPLSAIDADAAVAVPTTQQAVAVRSSTATGASSPSLPDPLDVACLPVECADAVECDPLDNKPLNNQCAICFDESIDQKSITFAKLPCCGHADATSTIKVCTSCVLVLTTPTWDSSSRVGRCPRCRSWIVLKNQITEEELEISTVTAAGKCKICNQIKDHLVEDGTNCDACFLGRRHPLLYECETCHCTQQIPHPMYRYQASPEQFGTVTWACHGACGKFTRWRVRSDQVGLIPLGDAPWGKDQYLQSARARVRLARNKVTPHEDLDVCAIL